MLPQADGPRKGEPSFQVDPRLLVELAGVRKLWKGRVIGVQAQPCDSLFIITEGQVLLSRQNPDGEEYALYLLGPGQIFGEDETRLFTKVVNLAEAAGKPVSETWLYRWTP